MSLRNWRNNMRQPSLRDMGRLRLKHLNYCQELGVITPKMKAQMTLILLKERYEAQCKLSEKKRFTNYLWKPFQKILKMWN